MRLLTLTQSIIVAGMVAVVFFCDLHPLAGSLEINTFLLIVSVLYKKALFLLYLTSADWY